MDFIWAVDARERVWNLLIDQLDLCWKDEQPALIPRAG
jgi:hypothetical protein